MKISSSQGMSKMTDQIQIKFVKQDKLDEIKSNLDVDYKLFLDEDNSRFLSKYGGEDIFLDSSFKMKEISFDMSDNKAPETTDLNNSKLIYEELKEIPASVAADERFWAGLCLGPFWKYVRYRWLTKNLKNDKVTPDNIRAHYFFGKNSTRRNLMRNGLSRLWLIAHLTYDVSLEDKYELTKELCKDTRFVHDTLERNFSNDKRILKTFLRTSIDLKKQYNINTSNIRLFEMYLDEIGGTYILDSLDENTIKEKLIKRAKKLCARGVFSEKEN